VKPYQPISPLWLAIAVVAWPVIAVVLLALAAVACAIAWLAIPFWNDIVGSIDTHPEFYE
jgi:hypothetical protein